jgi:hypothetical protein
MNSSQDCRLYDKIQFYAYAYELGIYGCTKMIQVLYA